MSRLDMCLPFSSKQQRLGLVKSGGTLGPGCCEYGGLAKHGHLLTVLGPNSNHCILQILRLICSNLKLEAILAHFSDLSLGPNQNHNH